MLRCGRAALAMGQLLVRRCNGRPARRWPLPWRPARPLHALAQRAAAACLSRAPAALLPSGVCTWGRGDANMWQRACPFAIPLPPHAHTLPMKARIAGDFVTTGGVCTHRHIGTGPEVMPGLA
ncbi:hypothetical protein FNV43_RR20955 [Rhamnella rubrinervis]|uniref:Uncharacterized protein n=1 Tax=Rhamnella rubrinervis TaxID=2594499 RepID=A0A8K0E2E9_9ROSA|nr:hypothetical protein FNV43_RR20955 [Rhamnella rubrinervis]